ncbi:translation protein SH3-like domain-containing protein, partial [Dimargaris cristalligena]
STRLQPVEKYILDKDKIKSWKIVRGDKVMIMTGKNKGESGTVSRVIRKMNQIMIGGKNLVYKHVPMTSSSPDGKIQIEAPVHVTNVALLDPSTGRPTKVYTRKVLDEETKKLVATRFAKETNTEIPKPKFTAYQFARKDGPHDTDADVVAEVTYKPSLLEPVFPNGVLYELSNVRKK